jgi:BMFP domain-containing protein YqiC
VIRGAADARLTKGFSDEPVESRKPMSNASRSKLFAAPRIGLGYSRRPDQAAKEQAMAMENRILDDLAKVASGALSGITGVRQEIEAKLRQQFERILADMAVVNREEFEAVKAMAAKARTEQEQMAARLEALEQRLARIESAGAGQPPATTTP